MKKSPGSLRYPVWWLRSYYARLLDCDLSARLAVTSTPKPATELPRLQASLLNSRGRRFMLAGYGCNAGHLRRQAHRSCHVFVERKPRGNRTRSCAVGAAHQPASKYAHAHPWKREHRIALDLGIPALVETHRAAQNAVRCFGWPLNGRSVESQPVKLARSFYT